MAPLVGIVGSYNPANAVYFVKPDYVTSVRRAGGIPVLLTLEQELEEIPQLLEHLDCVLFPGGPDVSPLLYGEEPIREVTYSVEAQDRFEIELVRQCVKANKPIFGICRGAQVINVALGGTLYQDIYVQAGATLCHRQDMKLRSERTHTISIVPNTLLHSLLECTDTAVNSYHHQAVHTLGEGLKASAWSKDGILEAFEGTQAPILAVQFHPENLSRLFPAFQSLFNQLVHWENQ